MATKLYLHDAASTVAGTLPGVTDLSSQTPNVTATNAAVNKTMNSTIGVATLTPIINSAAIATPQRDWFRRFLSLPLAAQTIDLTTAGDVVLACGMTQSNTNANLAIIIQVLLVWRPTTGAIVQTLIDDGTTGTTSKCTSAGVTTAQWISGTNGAAAASVTIQDGDILVAEIWSSNTQGMSTTYNYSFAHDGATEGSTTDPASYINFPNDTIQFFRARPIEVVQQAVQRSAYFCFGDLWARKGRLWVPTPKIARPRPVIA